MLQLGFDGPMLFVRRRFVWFLLACCRQYSMFVYYISGCEDGFDVDAIVAPTAYALNLALNLHQKDIAYRVVVGLLVSVIALMADPW